MLTKEEKELAKDLCVDRHVITKVNIPKRGNNEIVELSIQLFAIPTEECETFEYKNKISRISKFTGKCLDNYIKQHDGIFFSNTILDINFTLANLKKGYNKSVQISLFAKKRREFEITRLRKKIKTTIKKTVMDISNKFNEEGFKCYKKKQIINKKMKK